MNKYQKVTIVILTLAVFTSGFIIGKFSHSRGIPFVGKKYYIWSIGIYMGDSPFNLTPPNNLKNPVLSAKDVTDIHADFLADPFMVRENSTWYLFFEVMNADTKQGDIGFATSADGLHWNYKQIVLDEPFHLSYPYVFKWGNEYYMIPETCKKNSVRLYKAINFPTKWILESTLIEGENFRDNSIVFFNNKWWIFTSEAANDNLHLYYANNLLGPWTEHPQSPVINGDLHRARGGGRVIVLNGKVIRYAQDNNLYYGYQVRAFEITELTTSSYKEKEVTGNPILKPSGKGWNSKGMHTVDPHRLDSGDWIACVDGWRESLVFGLKY